jgi:dimethylaniline monooxygenase (N-oxide forming)
MDAAHSVSGPSTDTVAEPRPTPAAEACIIGAGVSGLTAAKALKEAGLSFEGFELGSSIGGMWRYENDSGTSSAYRSLHIDSSHRSLAFPDFAIPEHMPDYLSHRQVLEHLERYAKQFDASSSIRFRTRVVAVEPAPGGAWDVRFQSAAAGDSAHRQEVRRYRAVIVANGHLSDPKLPDFPGEFSGPQSHSHHYRVADPYEDKSVLVVGIGNSAVDIAVDLARRARKVFLSTRRSAWVMPKYIAGVPTDRWSKVLVRDLRIPVPAARGILRHMARLAIGNQERFGVRRPEHPIWREHATISQDLLSYLGHGWISMKPNVQRLDGDHVLFTDGSREPVDAIIYATGYRTSFPFLRSEVFSVQDGTPPALYRRIVSIERPGLFFSGLVQPVGPTIPLVEIQARWIAAVLSGRIALPARHSMQAEVERHRGKVARRYVQAARYTLEVDFKEYAGQLSRDIAAAAQRSPAQLGSRLAATE